MARFLASDSAGTAELRSPHPCRASTFRNYGPPKSFKMRMPAQAGAHLQLIPIQLGQHRRVEVRTPLQDKSQTQNADAAPSRASVSGAPAGS